MQKDRRNIHRIESGHDQHHAQADNDPNRLSTADSGRGSILFSDRSTITSRITTQSVSSPFSVDTPLNNYESVIPSKKTEEKPIRIARTHIIRGKMYSDAIVSHIDHPSAFFLQLYHSAEDFRKLQSKINEYYSKTPVSNPSKTWKRGEYCIAKFTDNLFYRARIIEIPEVNQTDDQYDVVYIDYGNWTKVRSSDIHTILPEFAQLSAQAIPCTLSETLPRSNTWFEHPKAIQLFEALVYNKRVYATFILRNDRDCWPLNIVKLDIFSNEIVSDVQEYLQKGNLMRKDSNDKFYSEFSRLLQNVDYLIYNIRHENDEINDTDDDDDDEEN